MTVESTCLFLFLTNPTSEDRVPMKHSFLHPAVNKDSL